VPGTFREVERQLSGIEDGTDEHLIEAARLQAAATVPPAYRTGETDLPVTHPGGDPAGHGGALFRSEARMDGTTTTRSCPTTRPWTRPPRRSSRRSPRAPTSRPRWPSR
jgi:hypothetical protein